MSESVTVETPSTEEPPAQEETTDWKAEARKWEQRSKENKAAAEKLAAFEESQKTEAQKTADRLAALEAENNAFKQRDQLAAWATEITKDSHVPASLLRGETQEELQSHFDALKGVIPATQEPAPTVARFTIPTEGTSPTPLALNGDGIESAVKNALGIA